MLTSRAVKVDYPSLSDRALLSDRLADFKFSNNVAAADSKHGIKYGGKDDELDSEDEAAFQDPPEVIVDSMDIVNDADTGENVAPAEDAQDFFAGDDVGAGDDYEGFGGDAGYAHGGGEAEEMDEGTGNATAGFAPIDPRRAPDQRDLVMAMTEEGGASMMDYFDASITKNWAGPEHWKLRKVIRKRMCSICDDAASC
jgi:condensin complex subunit 2